MKLRIALLTGFMFLALTGFTLATDVQPQATATPSPEAATPTIAPETTAAAQIVTGSVSGKVVSGSNVELAAGLTVTLHGYDLDADSNASEVVLLYGTTDAGGSYLFEGVEIPIGRIFLVETIYQGVNFQSDYVFAETPSVRLPDLTLYEVSTDMSNITVDQVHVALNYDTAEVIQVVEMFIMTNISDYAVTFDTDGSSIPFIQVPENASDLSFQIASGSANFIGTDTGIVMLPLTDGSQYGLVAVFTVPYEKKLTLDLPFTLAVKEMTFFVPEGIKVRSDQLTDNGSEDYSGVIYHLYGATDFPADTSLVVKISGTPDETPAAGAGTSSQTQQLLIIGLGTGGMLLIGLGLYLFIRDRNRKLDEEEDLEDELAGRMDELALAAGNAPTEPAVVQADEMPAGLEDKVEAVSAQLESQAEEVSARMDGEALTEPAPVNPEEKNALLDAIIALDEQYKTGGIDSKAFEKRRSELKAQLRKLL